MDTDNGYQNNVCFSNVPVEALNEIAFRLDPRLFLFAYYSPKPYHAEESWYSRFRTAIVNLYGLLWDCGPFLRGLMQTQNSILWKNQMRIQAEYYELHSVISAFRSIFCHNCSRELGLNEEHYIIAEDFISSNLGSDLEILDLKEAHWQSLLSVFSNDAQTLSGDLCDSLEFIVNSGQADRKTNTVNWWIEKIAESYQKNPDYLLHTMSVLYRWYLDNGGQPASGNGSAPLRSRTIRWLIEFCGAESWNTWYTKWLPARDALKASRLYQLLDTWPSQWAIWNDCSESECTEPPLPGGPFFRILAQDVDRFASNPNIEYQK